MTGLARPLRVFAPLRETWVFPILRISDFEFGNLPVRGMNPRTPLVQGHLKRVLENWCPPIPGCHLPLPEPPPLLTGIRLAG